MELNGKIVREQVLNNIKSEVINLLDHGKRAPSCAVILIGNDAASETYVKNKEQAFKSVGMMSHVYRLDDLVLEQQVLELIELLNKDDEIDGILLQLPIPKHLNATKLIQAIHPDKDVDGLTYLNQGRLLTEEGLKPCTPLGIMEILKYYKVDVCGKDCLVIGRSDLVGRPISLLLQQANATVTMAHSKTKNLFELVKQADMVVVAAGKSGLIQAEHVHASSIIIDVGIHRVNGKLVGDCDPRVYEKCAAYTPVPKGVGPMTVAMLIRNTLLSYQRSQG